MFVGKSSNSYFWLKYCRGEGDLRHFCRECRKAEEDSTAQQANDPRNVLGFPSVFPPKGAQADGTLNFTHWVFMEVTLASVQTGL